MLSQLVLGVVLLLGGTDPKVVGTWGLGGAPFVTFAANGTGEMEGESFTWSAAKGVLRITADGETETIAYVVKDGQLALSMDGMPMTFEKIGGAAPKGVRVKVKEGEVVGTAELGLASPPVAPAAPAKAGNDPLSRLLLSSAWCTFSYNQVTGYSNSSRIQFFPNGTFTTGARGEGYSSGYGGTMASQHDSSAGGTWKVVNGTLHLSGPETNGQLVPVPLQQKVNSNGFPILIADGKEYSQCQ